MVEFIQGEAQPATEKLIIRAKKTSYQGGYGTGFNPAQLVLPIVWNPESGQNWYSMGFQEDVMEFHRGFHGM